MPGLIGFYTFGEGRENWDASHFIHYGLSALQGRGQESVSLATIGQGNTLHTLAGKGGVEEFFQKNRTSIPKGFIGIGQTSSYIDDYLVHVKTPYEMALALDGKTDLHENRGEATKLFARQLSQLLHSEKEPLKATSMLINKIGGGYSFAALTHKQELFTGRNPLGVKPLETGSVGFDIAAVVSETCALDVMGIDHTGPVETGEVIIFTPENIRAALKQTQKERLVGVQLKLNPVKSAVEDRDVVLVDDSVVRGNTLQNTVLNLKRNGAQRMHVRIGSPALVSPCPYGVEIPPRDELISGMLDEEKLANSVGADSISFMTVEELQRAIGLPRENLCMRCFE